MNDQNNNVPKLTAEVSELFQRVVALETKQKLLTHELSRVVRSLSSATSHLARFSIALKKDEHDAAMKAFDRAFESCSEASRIVEELQKDV